MHRAFRETVLKASPGTGNQASFPPRVLALLGWRA